MASQNVCFYNKYGYCKYAEKCRKFHEKETCEKSNCEITECKLRHPIMCKYFRDYGFCKFTDWCKFSHKLVTNSDKRSDTDLAHTFAPMHLGNVYTKSVLEKSMWPILTYKKIMHVWHYQLPFCIISFKKYLSVLKELTYHPPPPQPSPPSEKPWLNIWGP